MFLAIIGWIALLYIVVGLLFATASFLGSKYMNCFHDVEERIVSALGGIIIWPKVVYYMIEDIDWNNVVERIKKKVNFKK